MKQKRLYIIYFAGLVIVTLPFVIQSQDLQQQQSITTQKYKTPQHSRAEKPSFLKIQYIPPALDRRSPKWRVSSGGTRNATLSTPLQVTLLSPSHVARTVSAQPILYWYLSHDTQLPAIFTIIEVDAVKPLVETTIEDPATKGFHAIQLNEFGIELQNEKTYEWSISLIKNRQNLYPSSGDIVEKAFLERISEDSLAINTPSKNDTVERARIYAKNGIWYESLEMVMGKDPNAIHNREILETRYDLLKQVGLVNLE